MDGKSNRRNKAEFSDFPPSCGLGLTFARFKKRREVGVGVRVAATFDHAAFLVSIIEQRCIDISVAHD